MNVFRAVTLTLSATLMAFATGLACEPRESESTNDASPPPTDTSSSDADPSDTDPSDAKTPVEAQVEDPADASVDTAVPRSVPPGTLDTSFGRGGKVTIDFDGYADEAHAVAVGTNGRIFVVGEGGGSPESFAVACLRADGSLDPTFGVGGRLTTVFHRPDGSVGRSSADAVAVYPDGRVLVAGRAHVNTKGSLYLATPDGGLANDDFAFVRYLANGALDPSFGAGGIALINVDSLQERVQSVVLGEGGTILATGFEQFIPEINKLIVLRLLQDGRLDPTFATNGALVYTHPSPPGRNTDQRGYALAVDGQNASTSFVVGGALRPAAERYHALAARFDKNGALDPTFGSGGVSLARFETGSDDTWAFASKLAVGGSIYLGGSSGKSPVVMRLSPNGGVDTTFGVEGVARVPVQDKGIGYALVLAGGLPVLGGVAIAGNKMTPILHRFLANGAPDPAFANGAPLYAVQGVAGISALATDGEHSIVAAGTEIASPSSTKNDMLVMRVGN